MTKSRLLLGILCLALFSGAASAQSATHSVALSWAAPTTTLTVTGYNVYKLSGACPASISLTAFTKLTSVTTIAYTDTSVTAGSTYCYTVTAVTAGGESGIPGTMQATIPIFTASNVSPPPNNFAVQAQ